MEGLRNPLASSWNSLKLPWEIFNWNIFHHHFRKYIFDILQLKDLQNILLFSAILFVLSRIIKRLEADFITIFVNTFYVLSAGQSTKFEAIICGKTVEDSIGHSIIL